MLRAHNFPVGCLVEHRENGSQGVVITHNEPGTECKVEWTDGLLRGRTLMMVPFNLDRVARHQVEPHEVGLKHTLPVPSGPTYSEYDYRLKGAWLMLLEADAILARGIGRIGEVGKNVRELTKLDLLREDLLMLEVQENCVNMLADAGIERPAAPPKARARERWVWFTRAKILPEVPGTIYRDGIAALYK